MSWDPFDARLGLIYLGVAVALIAAREIGLRAGHWTRSRIGDEAAGEVATLQGELAGLLALLLGFTFAMAAARFETRKGLVMEEANSIAATYLEAEALPEPASSELQDLLRRYVGVRREFYDAGSNRQRINAAAGRAGQIQREVWARAGILARSDPYSEATALFSQTVNRMIESDARRRVALQDHVPSIIFGGLLLVAFVTIGATGYGSGLTRSGRRDPLGTLVVPLLVAAVFTLIVDLDRPRRGLMRPSQVALIELDEALQKEGWVTRLHQDQEDPDGERP